MYTQPTVFRQTRTIKYVCNELFSAKQKVLVLQNVAQGARENESINMEGINCAQA